MENEYHSILKALKYTLKQRDTFIQVLLDENISLRVQSHAVLEIAAQHRDLIEQVLDSLSNMSAGYTPAGKEAIRTLVLIRNKLNALTLDADLDTKVTEIEKNRD